jgi:glycosyltransferase involved in cell wall biosynthesis
VFDTGVKAAQVIPNKVVQCAAMRKPIVTRRGPSIERDFADGQSVCLVPAGDARALADAIVRLAGDPERRAALGVGARAVFDREFSLAAQTERMHALLASATGVE